MLGRVDVGAVTGGPAVLVTGASSGIGRDACTYLHGLGYTVLGTVRHIADGEALRAAVSEPDRLHPVVVDVTDTAGVAAARDEVAELVGGRGLAGLFSNAGIAAYSGDLSCEGCPLETQPRVMDVNHFGAVRVVQAFLPLVRRARGTIVINTALMTRTVIPFNAGYAASKAALETWADSLRREVRPHGVRVVVVRAAAVSSALESKQDPDAIPTDTPYPEQAGLARYFLAMQARHHDDPSCSPRRVSEKVAAALQSSHPAPKVIVGGGALPIWALGGLPARVQDAVIGAAVGRFGAGGRQPASTPAPH